MKREEGGDLGGGKGDSEVGIVVCEVSIVVCEVGIVVCEVGIVVCEVGKCKLDGLDGVKE